MATSELCYTRNFLQGTSLVLGWIFNRRCKCGTCASRGKSQKKELSCAIANHNSQGQEEWKAKVRWITAVLFFRVRHYNTSVIRAILLAFQPSQEGVLDVTSSLIVSWHKDIILELQDAVWIAHEGLAKTFLTKTRAGKQYLRTYSKLRLGCAFLSSLAQLLMLKSSNGHRPRPQITPQQLQDLLPLSVGDVRGIWACIEYTSDYAYWDPLSRSTKVIMEALRRASYGLLVRIVTHWVRKGKSSTRLSQLSLSAAARSKDLQATSHAEDPPIWPKPPPRTDRPSSATEWAEFASTYSSPSESPLYQRLIERITEPSIQSSPAKSRNAPGNKPVSARKNIDEENDEDGDGDEEDECSSLSSIGSSRLGSLSGLDSGPDIVSARGPDTKGASKSMISLM